MRTRLNVIVDVLTLVAIAVAGVGHMLPWFRADLPQRRDDVRFGSGPGPGVDFKEWERQRDARDKERDEELRQRRVELMNYQAWHASRSGIALGVLGVLVFLSLAVNWGHGARKVLVILMFISALAALIFITLSHTAYPITPLHERFAGTVRDDGGFPTALAPTCVAAALCLIRMLWTMPPPRGQPVAAPLPPVIQAEPLDRAPARPFTDSPRKPNVFSQD
jgi:hypothetical protein